MSVSTAKNGLGRHAPNQLVLRRHAPKQLMLRRHAPNQLVLIKPPLSPSLALYYKDVAEEMKRYSVFMASSILHICPAWSE